jgi:hypothetical protein
MTVMNEQKLAFRDMTKEEQLAIIEAKQKGNVESYHSHYEVWEEADTLAVQFSGVYRTKPKQLVIPWDVIKKEYKWAAMNKNGNVYFFPREPIIFRDDSFWDCGGERQLSIVEINTKGVQWQNSKTQRPEDM